MFLSLIHISQYNGRQPEGRRQQNQSFRDRQQEDISLRTSEQVLQVRHKLMCHREGDIYQAQIRPYLHIFCKLDQV